MNTLVCDGCTVTFKTKSSRLIEAVGELEDLCNKYGIDIEMSGLMRLYKEKKLSEVV